MFLGDARFVGPDAVEVDGRRLRFDKALIATESHIRVCWSPNGKYGAVWQRFEDPIQDAWYSPLLKVFGMEPSGTRQSLIVVYELPTGTKVAALGENDVCSIRPPSFSPDGTILAVAYENEVRVYDFPLHEPWLRIAGFALLGASLAFGLGQLVARRRRRLIAAATSRVPSDSAS